MEFDQIPGARCQQTMVSMRDGTQLNTFIYLPEGGGPTFPVIMQRTPYGITAPECNDPKDCARGWLPDKEEPLRGSLLRGWRAIVARGYAAVYQDTRGRFGSEGEDLVYGKDAEDGHDTLGWVARQPWSNQSVGLSGSSAGATTALAAASGGHPSVRAFFAQVGGSSIYDDVVYEGQSIEMERLWLWVGKNIAGLSSSHRAAAAARANVTLARLDDAAASAAARYQRLDAARHTTPAFIGSEDWLRLPLLAYPDFALWQPYLDEILSHPLPDEFRKRHAFRDSITVPGFHVTTWFDIFQTSVINAFAELHQRHGNQRLWVGPNDHYFVYASAFWPRDPFFEWFDHWLKGESTPIVGEPPVYYSPRAWVPARADYVPDDWLHAENWPPPSSVSRRLDLGSDGTLRGGLLNGTLTPSADSGPRGATRSFRYDPRRPIPTVGGRNMLIDAGPLDQRPVEGRSDYGLMYTSAPLKTDLTLAGPVTVTLHVESDCPDTDFVAKLVELRPDGASVLLVDGVIRVMLRDPAKGAQRLRAGEVVNVRLELGHIAHTVTAENCLRVDITSSNFPRRARNTNSGNLLLAADSEKDIRVARNTVHHGPATPSWVELSVLE